MITFLDGMVGFITALGRALAGDADQARITVLGSPVPLSARGARMDPKPLPEGPARVSSVMIRPARRPSLFIKDGSRLRDLARTKLDESSL